MPQSAVLDLTATPDNSGLAIALDRFRITAKSRDEPARQFKSERLQHIHEGLYFFVIFSGERIGDDGNG